jgi:hypothetical protein
MATRPLRRQSACRVRHGAGRPRPIAAAAAIATARGQHRSSNPGLSMRTAHRPEQNITETRRSTSEILAITGPCRAKLVFRPKRMSSTRRGMSGLVRGCKAHASNDRKRSSSRLITTRPCQKIEIHHRRLVSRLSDRGMRQLLVVVPRSACPTVSVERNSTKNSIAPSSLHAGFSGGAPHLTGRRPSRYLNMGCGRCCWRSNATTRADCTSSAEQRIRGVGQRMHRRSLIFRRDVRP